MMSPLAVTFDFGQTLCDLDAGMLARRLGEREIGAEAPAAWTIDTRGQETAFCCLNIVLRDWARLGLMMANDGANSLTPTGGFDPACVFRRCPGCGSINVVKGGVFECGACGAELPSVYNCQPQEAEPGAAADGPRL